MDQKLHVAACWLVFVCTSEYFVGIQTEDDLSCWTVNVTEDKTSYLYYYRGDPGEFVKQITGGSQPRIPSIPFNSSAYVLGAIAADNKQPISLFVHDKISGGIYRFEDNLKSLQPVFKGSSVKVEDIAVDWLSNNIYYTDPLLGVGLVSYTKHFAIIIHKVAALHGIDVDPMSRLLFYADGDSGHIYQASLTGDDHKVLSGSQTTNPTALVVDAVKKVLYWLDEGTQYLQSWNYARSEFKKIWNSYTVGVGLFTGIDLYDPYLFVSLKNEQRMKVITTNGTDVLSFSPSSGTGSRSYGISISTPDRKPHIASGCDRNNGGCEHICIHESNIGSECFCQFGYSQYSDSCIPEVVPDDFLLFTDSSSNILYQVDTRKQEFHTLYVSSSLNSSPGNPVYDPEEQNVYWVEKNMHEIWSMDLVEGNPELFVDLGTSSSIHTIIVPVPNRYMYYTDTELRRIGRINLSTKKTEVILQLTSEEKPTYLQVDVDERYMYWINSGNMPKIERANVNAGSNRQIIISGDLQIPSGLALDQNVSTLYWVDEHLHKIERSNFDGSRRELFVVTPAKYRGLTLDAEFLYTAGRRSLFRIGKNERNVEQLGPEYFLITSSVSYCSRSYGSHSRWQSNDRRPNQKNVIIGGIIGVVVLLVIITALTVVWLRRHNNGKRVHEDRTRHATSDSSQVIRNSEVDMYEEIDVNNVQELDPDTVEDRPVPPPRPHPAVHQIDDIDQYLSMRPAR